MTSDARRLLGGRYVLDSRIGSGNYAEIYRACDAQTQALVAIKTLRPEHSTEQQAVSLFQKEGEVGAAIAHANVVKIWSHGIDDDVYYIVMELVRGISLRRRLTLAGRLSISESLRVMKAILRGLDAVHAAGYVHRDIKPQNILIDATGIPKITDFGIALCAGETRCNQNGLTLGTAAYIAPEQAAGEEIGPQADIYSAGAVLFEMLTGEPPFPGDDPIAVMNRHLFEPPRDPRSINAEIPPALAAIVMRALAKEPAARFSSARRMREALELVDTKSEILSPLKQLVPAGNLAWTVPLAPSRRLPIRLLGMPPLTTFVSALLLVVLIIVLMLALVSSMVTASSSQVRVSSSQAPSGFAGGSTPFDDLSSSRNSTIAHTSSVPDWSADAAVSSATPSATTVSTPEATSVPAITQVHATTAQQPTIDVSSPIQQPTTVAETQPAPAATPAPHQTVEHSTNGTSMPESEQGNSHQAGQTNGPAKPPKPDKQPAADNPAKPSKQDKPQKPDKPPNQHDQPKPLVHGAGPDGGGGGKGHGGPDHHGHG